MSRRLRRRSMDLFAVAVFLLIAFSLPVTKGEQKFSVQPVDITTVAGTSVLLPCVVQHKVGPLQWTRDGFGLGTERELGGFPRYTMVGDDSNGNFSLLILNVRLEDDATFQCQVGAADGVPGNRSTNAKLTVQVPPEPPVIVQGTSLKTTAGMQLSLECEARAGKPAAQLEWVNGNGVTFTSGVSVTSEVLSDAKRVNAKATLALTPTKEHHGKTLTCRAKHPALPQPAVAKLHMEVKYAPEVTLAVNSTKITEMDTVTFMCAAQGNPNDLLYQWYRNSEVIPGNHTTMLTIPTISREFHGNAISCEVRNSVGTIKATSTLDVRFAPKFVTAPAAVSADTGSQVVLKCDVRGNPPPEISWTFENCEHIVGTGSMLTLPAIKADKAGHYQCRVAVAGFPPVHGDYLVLLKDRPNVRSEPVQFGLEGSTLNIECNIRSVPPPTKVMWSYAGMDIDPELNNRYSVQVEPLVDGARHTLVVRDSSAADFGGYNCTVRNEFGENSMTIVLRKQAMAPVLIILAGVIGGIAVFVAVTVVIVLAVRRHRRSTREDGEPEKQSRTSEPSSNDSDMKVEVRTSSSMSNNDGEPWEEASVDTVRRDSHDTYRYSSDYVEPSFPPKESHNNNGYVPYVDYQRDYNPPPLTTSDPRSSMYGVLQSQPGHVGAGVGTSRNVDPRYQAAYANPYLRTSHSHLPPPSSYGTVPIPSRNPAGGNNTQYITSTETHMKPGTLATPV